MLSLVNSLNGENTRTGRVQEIENLGFSRGSAESIIDSAKVQFNLLDPVIEQPGLVVARWVNAALFKIHLKKMSSYSANIKELLGATIYIGMAWGTLAA